MEGIAIQPKHVFGVKADVTGCIHHIEDSRVVYSAGHNVVVYNTEYREMNFYPGLEGS